MRQQLKRFIGCIFILLGLFALLTPMTPGSWLILIGMEMIGLGFLIPRKVRSAWDKKKEGLPLPFMQKNKH